MTRLIKITSCDDLEFEVPEAVAIQSVMIKITIEAVGDDLPIPAMEVTGEILEKVLEYCTRHVEYEAADGGERKGNSVAAQWALETWDQCFLNSLSDKTLWAILMAANYLEIVSLMDLCSQRIASMVAGKSVEEIREIFNIVNDFTPEEEEEVRRENSWAFN